MAKGLRASNKKTNKSNLRTKVFKPVEDARTERLSAKLLELASAVKPNPALDTRMDVDGTGVHSTVERGTMLTRGLRQIRRRGRKWLMMRMILKWKVSDGVSRILLQMTRHSPNISSRWGRNTSTACPTRTEAH